MRARNIALWVCLFGWASSPAMGLVISIHLSEHHSAQGARPIDLVLLAAHGHHHELDVPDHTHKIIPVSDAVGPELPALRTDLELHSSEGLGPSSPFQEPVGLPPPQLHILCAMLL